MATVTGVGGSSWSPELSLALLVSVPTGVMMVSSPRGPVRGHLRGIAGRCVRTAVPQVTHIQVGWEEKTPGSQPVQGQKTPSEPRSPCRIQERWSSWFFIKPSVVICRQSSHFPAVHPGWRSALAGGLCAVSSSGPPPAGPPSPRIAFIPGTPSPSSRAAFAVLVSGGWDPRERARKAQGFRAYPRPHPLPLPWAAGCAPASGGAFPTGPCGCLAPSSGREGEGAAGGRQARAHH